MEETAGEKWGLVPLPAQFGNRGGEVAPSNVESPGEHVEEGGEGLKPTLNPFKGHKEKNGRKGRSKNKLDA